jgi:hypothetical protein
MGYGPCDENRHGFCWRNEHGNGTRLSPYFVTEDDCTEFHDYIDTWLKTNNLHIPEHIKPILRMEQMMRNNFGPLRMGADLRTWKLSDVIRCAKDFEAVVKRKVIAPCVGETMLEFFGCDIDKSHDDYQTYLKPYEDGSVEDDAGGEGDAEEGADNKEKKRAAIATKDEDAEGIVETRGLPAEEAETANSEPRKKIKS